MEPRQLQRGGVGGTKPLMKLQLNLPRNQQLLSLLPRHPLHPMLPGLKLQAGKILVQKPRAQEVLLQLLGCGILPQHTQLQAERKVGQRHLGTELQLQEPVPGETDGMKLPAQTGKLQLMQAGLKLHDQFSQGIKSYQKLQLPQPVSVAPGGMRLLELHQV